MPTFDHTIDVVAPADRVFEFVTDPANWRRTHPGLTDLEILEETDGETRMAATYRTLGVANEGELVLTVREPDAHAVVTFESPSLAGAVHYRFAESNGVTTVHESAEFEFGDSLRDRVVEPIGKHVLKRQFRTALEAARDLMAAELPRGERLAA